MLQFDPNTILPKILAMRFGLFVVIPTLFLTGVFIIGILLYAVHLALTTLNPPSRGIWFLTWLAQQEWAAILSAVIVIALVVMWSSIILLASKTPIDLRNAQIIKSEGTRLSHQILTFLDERSQGEPSLPRKGTWQQDVEANTRYSMETLSQYHERFGARTIAIYERMTELGYKSEEIERLYKHPTNPLGMREVAQGIGAIAEKMPP